MAIYGAQQNVGWACCYWMILFTTNEQTQIASDLTEIRLRDVLLNITGASIGITVADERIVGGNVKQHYSASSARNPMNWDIVPRISFYFERKQKQIESSSQAQSAKGLNFA